MTIMPTSNATAGTTRRPPSRGTRSSPTPTSHRKETDAGQVEPVLGHAGVQGEEVGDGEKANEEPECAEAAQALTTPRPPGTDRKSHQHGDPGDRQRDVEHFVRSVGEARRGEHLPLHEKFVRKQQQAAVITESAEHENPLGG